MQGRLFFWALTAALAGFLFGFDTVVTWFSPGIVFAFFAFMMVLQLVWVKLMVPETKGRPLEDLEHGL